MENQDIRTISVIGENAFHKLNNAHVVVFGVGGVGGHCIDALCRAGIKNLTIVDHDVVSISNLNRQFVANYQTIGMKKVEVMAAHLKNIRNDVNVRILDTFYLPDSAMDDLFEHCDYIVDCIDTITAKIDLAIKAQDYHIPMISCMGTGNKKHPELLKISDIYNTKICPLCKVMRRELKKRQVKNLKVVYSEEMPQTSNLDNPRTPGSISFVPATAGLLIASVVVNELI